MGAKGLKVLKFDMPFTTAPPAMRSEAMGFSRVMERRSASHTIDVTIIDSPDHRLLRAGVVVAHRVLAGLGEWYISAPSWQPWLPEEHIEELGATAELPDDIARRIRPFVRRSAIGPVAALTCERSEYVLRGLDDENLAEIRDERVTVRRNQVATARYREATVVPQVKFTPQQREFILASMDSASATVVNEFPSLQQRLGPPATGLSDFAAYGKLRRNASLEDFVTTVFAADLQQLVETLLAFEVADEPDVGSLATHLDHVRRDVRGLTTVLEPQWRSQVEALTQPGDDEGPRAVAERAIDVVDALVVAVRAPKLGDTSQVDARNLLFRRAERAAYILSDRCRALTQDSPNDDWLAALQAAEQLHSTAQVGGPLLGKRGMRMRDRLLDMRNDLAECVLDAEPTQDVSDMTPQEAFQRGREVERESNTVRGHRRSFVDTWPTRVADLRALLAKLEKKL